MGVFDKCKNSSKEANKENMEYFIKFDANFKKIFSIKYLELFHHYYNDEQPLNELMIFGKEIILSSKTKSFYYLLDKNKNLREDIVNYAKMAYFNDNNSQESE